MSWSKFINALTDLDGFVSIYLLFQSWICLQPRLLSLLLHFCCWIEIHTRPEATKLKKEMKEAKKVEKDEKRRQKMHDERQSVIDERKQYCITFIPHRCSCCFLSFFFSGTAAHGSSHPDIILHFKEKRKRKWRSSRPWSKISSCNQW